MSHAVPHPILRLAADPDDRAAWSAAVEAYGGLCWRIALRMLRDEDDAANAVQDCLLALRAAARRFRPGPDPAGAAVAWVARIAVNTCHAHRRRQRPAAALPDDLAAAPAADADAETIDQLHAALAALPDNQREAVELRYLAELDYEQVGAALRIAPGAARVRVHRALEALHEGLAQRGVALSSVAVGALLDGLARSAVPAPATSLTTAWSSTALPPVAVATVSTGALITMSSILVAAGLAVTLTLAEQAPPTPLPPAPAPVPAPAPAPDQVRIDSVEAGLRWLAERQQPDGSWTPVIGAAATADERMLATSLAMAAFLGSGYDAGTPNRYRDRVAQAQTWLSGHLPTEASPLPARAWRTLAVAEHYAMTNNPAIRPVAEIAVTDLLAQRIGPGWPSRVGGTEIDARTTALGTMACKSAYAAGLSTGEALAELAAWVDAAWAKRTGAGFPARTTIDGTGIGTAEDDRAGAVVKLFADRVGGQDWRVLASRAAALPPTWTIDPGDDAGVHHATLVAFQAGGAAWTAVEQQLDQVRALAGRRVAQNDLGGMVHLLLVMEVHYRYAQVQGARLDAAPAVTH